MMANDDSGSDIESLPDLDEFLASSFEFDPDISHNKEEVGNRRTLTAKGYTLETYCFEWFLSGINDEDLESETVTIRL